jgi:hypothetical protein
MRVTLPPGQSHTLTYNLFPLACGRLPLPRHVWLQPRPAPPRRSQCAWMPTHPMPWNKRARRLSVRSLRDDAEISTDACPAYTYIKPAL